MEFQTETASLEHGTSSRNETAYLVCKRAFDIAASFCALVVLSPVFLIIYLIIYLDDPHGNPIFSQIRIGKNGKAFRFYKFRSMVVNAEDLLAGLQNQNEMSGPAFKMKNDPRVTKVGRFIRKTSLDELPQLWNVLKGDMSLVGPRPPLPNEVEQYTEEQKKRLSVTPGLTCYWQVQPSRNDLDFGEWFELDMKYLRERSMKTDIKIIFQTILVVLHMEGV
ncbi:sugar transferase [Ruthenibacterium lactatiformans]|jgi:lipopolysaccharide/colanic/teichoic acid biosynthesis glycosyltransferase|nr:sugar transferase [Ruthenibacterium lactatiformans]